MIAGKQLNVPLPSLLVGIVVGDRRSLGGMGTLVSGAGRSRARGSEAEPA